MSDKLKVLFVSSGNVKGFEVVPFIKEQGEAIRREGVDVEYYPIVGKGLKGYLRQAKQLRKYLKDKTFDVIHGHFVLSAWVAVLGSGKIPVIVSLMGSDAYGEYVGDRKVIFRSRYLTILTLLIQPFVKAIISKSANIDRYVYLKKKSYIVPNGIDTEKFRPLDSDFSGLNGIESGKRNVLFLGSKNSVRKNIQLVKKAIEKIGNPEINLVNPYPVGHAEIPKYLNKTDVLAMCSYMEGSPNVIKEAMACNCPMVATDVGDVKWVLGDVEGCYISSFDPDDYASKLKQALNYSEGGKRTRGRDRIFSLGLDSRDVAQRVISIYKSVLKK